MAEVFLSYSSKDRAAAERVQQALAARGIDVFWDQQTPPGQDWDTWIRSKLSACRIAVVLWSRNSVKSDSVRHEAMVARKAKKLLPAMIDAVDAEDLPMGLYIVQAINLTDWPSADAKGLAQLVAAVEAQLGRRTTSAPVAASATPASSPGLNPAVMILLALALIGGASWWLMSQQNPSPAASNRISGNQVFTPGDGATTSQPQAECLDRSTPTNGVCADGLRPIPPAPALGN
jgi:hypothetical protein